MRQFWGKFGYTKKTGFGVFASFALPLANSAVNTLTAKLTKTLQSTRNTWRNNERYVI